jgi:hypothetical protein
MSNPIALDRTLWNYQPSPGFRLHRVAARRIGPASCNILPPSPNSGATRRHFLTADCADYTDKK